MEMRLTITQKAGRAVLAAILALGTVLIVDGSAYAEPSQPAVSASADGSAASATADAQASYQQYLSDRTPTGSSVGWGDLYYDESYDGTPLSLLVDGQEQTFDHGFWAHADSSIYFNDIQEYGYERFEAMVGLSHTARVAGKSAEVVFKVVADGQTVWQSDPMTERSDAVEVSLDVSGYKVIQLVAEAVNKSAHPNNHAVWADAKFIKPQATPWLSVSDKEFSNPEQVTPANILEGAFARTLSGPVGETDAPVVGSDGTLRNGKEGNDLSDAITYSTDYVAGSTGNFSITYTVEDAQGLVRSRTVGMTVRGDEVFRADADLDYLTTPFASFLYAGRDYFDEQGKAAFDLSVKTLLDFGNDVDRYQLVNYWGQAWKVTINLQEHGIFMPTADANYLCSTIMDCEPRTFHVKDWGTQVTSKGGVAETVTFYVAPKYGEKDADGQVYYHTRLLQTEVNASRFLANIQDGMTDAQRLRAVLSPYSGWIRYEGGGQVMDEALADGRSVCGGNARGSIYLSQRMGVKAYWVRTTSHAWSNVKLNRDDSGVSGDRGLYYRIDLLAGSSCFISIDANHQGFHGHHKELHFNRMKGYPDMVSENYPYAWTAWPSVSLDVEDSWVVLAPEDAATFDPEKLVISASSIYEGDLKDSVEVDCGELRANDQGVFDAGYYPIVYTAADSRGNKATATVNVQVVGGDVIRANAENCAQNTNSTFLPDAGGNLPSLWNGSGEAVYSYGIAQNDGGKSVTYDVDRGNGVRLTCLDAWVGLHRSTRDSQWGYNGKVRFIVKASVPTADGGFEDRVLYTSADMTRYTVQEHVLVKIPEDAVSVTLTSESLGNGNGHARWGSPRFFTSDILDEVPVAPAISGVEDGAVYSHAVTPDVEGASRVNLYRKNLPVVVDPDTGLPVEDGAAETDAGLPISAALAPGDWGDEVAGYQVGDSVEDEGIYTLVAVNGYNQKAMVSFTIDHSAAPDDPAISFPQMTVGEEGPYAIEVHGPEGAAYSYEVADETILSIGEDGTIVPRAAGSTAVYVTMEIAGYGYGPYEVIATVDPRTVKLKTDDATIDAGQLLDSIGCRITEGSLMEGDSLEGLPFEVADAEGNPADYSHPGTYQVKVQGSALGSNYSVEVEPGILTVKKIETTLAGSDATATFGDVIDVSALFDADPVSDRIEYQIVAGSGTTGEGILDGHVLEVSKVGAFVIRAYIQADQDHAASEAVATLTVDRRVLAASDFAPLSSRVYTGDPIEPPVHAVGALSLQDFTVSYRDNVNAGAAAAVVTGVGNCSGQVTLAFAIERARADASMTHAEGLVAAGIQGSVTLPALPEGAAYGAPSSADGAVSSLSVNAGKLTFAGAEDVVAGQVYEVAVPVSGALNYEDYRIVVSLAGADADPGTIPGLSISFPEMTIGDGGSHRVGVKAPAGAAISYEVEDESILSISADGSIATKSAGSTLVNVTVSVDGVEYGPFPYLAVVSPRHLAVAVGDAQMFTGAALPAFSCELEGSLLPGDSLGDVAYSVVDEAGARADTSMPGTYRVIADVADLGSNYQVEVLPGALAVLQETVDASNLDDWVSVSFDGSKVAEGAWVNGPVTVSSLGRTGAAGVYDLVLAAGAASALGADDGKSIQIDAEGELSTALRLGVSAGQGANAGAFTSAFDVVTRIDETAPTASASVSFAGGEADADGAAGGAVKGEGPATVLVVADDVLPAGANKASGVTQVRVEVRSADGRTVFSGTEDASSTSLELADPGAYTVSAVAIDAAGNESAPAVLELEVTKAASDGSEADPDGGQGGGDEDGSGGTSDNEPNGGEGSGGTPGGPSGGGEGTGGDAGGAPGGDGGTTGNSGGGDGSAGDGASGPAGDGADTGASDSEKDAGELASTGDGAAWAAVPAIAAAFAASAVLVFLAMRRRD